MIELPVEVLEKIASKRNAKGIASRIADINKVVRHRREIEAEHDRAATKYEAAVKKRDADLAALKRMCNHDWTKYHGDPAGGSDSSTICEICGQEV